MKKLADAKNNPDVFKIEHTCTGKGWKQGGRKPCYALWEVAAYDILKRKSMDYGGGTEISYGFICPECGCFTEIDAAKLPYEVKSNAIEYTVEMQQV